jgi:Bacteriophage translational regulator
MTSSIDIIGSDLRRDYIIPFLVEVSIPDNTFLQVKESLMRVGIPGKPTVEGGKPSLHQTCHVLNKRGKYYICHFKTFFVLDGKRNDLSSGDIARQNLIIKLLEEWKLVTVTNSDMIGEYIASLKTIKVVRYQDREDWELVSKYDVGACIRKIAGITP